jgi:hypothetical protein
MKAHFAGLFLSVLCVSGNSYAFEKIIIKCNGEAVNCPALPLPPLPPTPPSPPPPPPPPPPPMPPAVPEVVVSAQAHLACAGKKIGTEITWEYANRSMMTGVCGERDGKPYLKLNHVFISNSSSH